jgi:hypothetical protein
MDIRVLRGLLAHHPVILNNNDLGQLRAMGLISAAQAAEIERAQRVLKNAAGLLEPLALRVHGPNQTGLVWDAIRRLTLGINNSLIRRLKAAEIEALASTQGKNLGEIQRVIAR